MYELLYTSTLSPATAITEIAAIVRHARQNNSALGVSGVLVFDGDRFCQYLEGPEAAVRALQARIEVDPRHTNFVMRHAGPRAGPLRFAKRSLSYGLALDQADMEIIMAATGPAAVVTLMTILPRLDLDP